MTIPRWVKRVLPVAAGGLGLYVFTWGVVTACYVVAVIREPAPLWLRTLYWPLDKLYERGPLSEPLRLWWHVCAWVLIKIWPGAAWPEP